MFTRVLKGHIGLDSQIFPMGTPGCMLDILARQHLWNIGKNYLHGNTTLYSLIFNYVIVNIVIALYSSNIIILGMISQVYFLYTCIYIYKELAMVLVQL